jgi:hypothetical protein
MTAQILRFPAPHIARPSEDPSATLARDIKSSLDAIDRDIAEFDARARRIRRLLMLRATAKKRLERQERILAFEKQLRAEQTAINDIREMFNHPA